MKKTIPSQLNSQRNSEMMNVQVPYILPAMPPLLAYSVLHPLGRPHMYRPTQSMIAFSSDPNVLLKRPHSPSATPTSGYQQQQQQHYENNKTTAMYTHPTQEFKPSTYPQAQEQQRPVMFVSQTVHSSPQSSGLYSTSKPTPPEVNTSQ